MKLNFAMCLVLFRWGHAGSNPWNFTTLNLPLATETQTSLTFEGGRVRDS